MGVFESDKEIFVLIAAAIAVIIQDAIVYPLMNTRIVLFLISSVREVIKIWISC